MKKHTYLFSVLKKPQMVGTEVFYEQERTSAWAGAYLSVGRRVQIQGNKNFMKKHTYLFSVLKKPQMVGTEVFYG